MERGLPGQTVYTFEAAPGVTMRYPDAELWTRDYDEARKYAQEQGYQLIGNNYEFEDSELIEDFTPGIECRYCGELVIPDSMGTLIDSTGGDVCTEHGDDLPHERQPAT